MYLYFINIINTTTINTSPTPTGIPIFIKFYLEESLFLLSILVIIGGAGSIIILSGVESFG